MSLSASGRSIERANTVQPATTKRPSARDGGCWEKNFFWIPTMCKMPGESKMEDFTHSNPIPLVIIATFAGFDK